MARSQDQLPEGFLYEVLGLMVTSEAFGQVAGQYGAISSAAVLGWEVLVNSGLSVKAISNGVVVSVCAENNSEGWSVTSRKSAHTSQAMEC